MTVNPGLVLGPLPTPIVNTLRARPRLTRRDLTTGGQRRAVYQSAPSHLWKGVSSFGDTEVERVEQLHADIRRYETSCGCEVGSVFALCALAGAIGHLVVARGGSVGWGHAAWAVGWVVAWAVVGKLIGLGYARVRLSQLRGQLTRARAHLGDERGGVGVPALATHGSVSAGDPNDAGTGRLKE